jgi:sec-independent protein translocase protein TatA
VLAEIFGLDGVIVVIVAVVVLFGGSQIPKLARSLGSAQKEFKNGLQEGAAPTANHEVVAIVPVAAPPTSNVPTS